MALTYRPGDLLIVHDPGIWAWWIRVGAWLRRQPHQWNHVLVVHHVDAAGTLWGIEGRPGGVGWRDLHASGYLTDTRTLSTARLWANATTEQLTLMRDGAQALLGTHYDWPAIIADGLRCVDPIWRLRDQWGPGAPGALVCSSMADYIAEQVGLRNPTADRLCTPADWAQLILRQA